MTRVQDIYPSDRVVLREVGLRDGLQLVKAFPSTAAKKDWIAREYDAGVRHFEVGSFLPAKTFPQFADVREMIKTVAALPGGFARQALHAWRLGLIHPVTGRAMQWRADVPDDMAELIAALGFGEKDEDYGFDDEVFDSAYTDEGYVIGSDEDDYDNEHDDDSEDPRA